MSNNKTYEDGLVDGIQKYGAFCSSFGDCSSCSVGKQLGSLSCAEFAKKFPQRFLAEANSGIGYSFYNEYCRRFPNSRMSVETLADSACRKVLFEGFTGCQGGDCVACWNEKFTTERTANNNTNTIQNAEPDLFESSTEVVIDDVADLFGTTQQEGEKVSGSNNIDNQFTNFSFL